MDCDCTPVFYFEKGVRMKLKYLLIAIVLLVYATGVYVSACEKSHGGNYHIYPEGYQCDDGQYFEVTWSRDHKVVYLYDRKLRKIIHIDRVHSKSGKKYSANDMTFWKKGKKAVIEIGGNKYNNCHIERELIFKDGLFAFICYDKNGKKVACPKEE